jgi:hypothetical protein
LPVAWSRQDRVNKFVAENPHFRLNS